MEWCTEQPQTALPPELGLPPHPNTALQIFRITHLGRSFLMGLGQGYLVDDLPHTTPYSNAVIDRLLKMVPDVKRLVFFEIARPGNAEPRVRTLVERATRNALPAIMVIGADNSTCAATVMALKRGSRQS